MRVSFDVDGVLADFVHSFTREAYYLRWLLPSKTLQNKVWIYRTPEQTEWNFDWPNDFYNEIWEEIDQIYNWWMGLEPLVSLEEINAINYLIKNHDVYFITGRKRTLGFPACKQTSLWLESIGVNASHSVVIATQHDKKHKLIQALDIEAHLDDRPSVALQIVNHSKAISCLIDRLYNRNTSVDKVFYSVKEYCEWIIEHSRKLEKNLIKNVKESSDLREKIIL